MEDGEDGKGGVEDQNSPKEEDKNLPGWIIGDETEDTVEPKENGHQCPDIFSDHLHLLILSIDVPNPHIIEGPQG